ncbi:MAG TPA: LLM class flavin-dependent oxidoreductase [Candidatus Binataceae bacterium]|nr:LLM class flavin-dependent oxidoreductase [Candidatus Binataceae bacterium]
MKFGLHFQLPCHGSQSPVQRYRDTIEQAVAGEAMGFESVWPVEQHFNPGLSIMPAPLLPLAAIAERTQRMKLGIAIVLLPLSHPLRVAEEIATLDVMSNGRVEFGVGRGAIPAHFRGFGVNQGDSRERLFEELDVIRQAWTQERLNYSGKFFQFENIEVVPKPVQKPYPPIRIAANSEDSFELMGREGYPIFAASQVNSFNRLRRLLPTYREARRAAGHRNNGGEDLTLLMPLFVGENREEIRRDTEPGIRHLLEIVASLYGQSAAKSEGGAKRIMELAQKVRSTTYEQASESMAVFDTPEACVERLRALRDEFNMGRTICWFNPGGALPHERVMRSMELFASKVMPHL